VDQNTPIQSLCGSHAQSGFATGFARTIFWAKPVERREGRKRYADLAEKCTDMNPRKRVCETWKSPTTIPNPLTPWAVAGPDEIPMACRVLFRSLEIFV
jgi:hypothetical protein